MMMMIIVEFDRKNGDRIGNFVGSWGSGETPVRSFSLGMGLSILGMKWYGIHVPIHAQRQRQDARFDLSGVNFVGQDSSSQHLA